jgi:hypothetical protein
MGNALGQSLRTGHPANRFALLLAASGALEGNDVESFDAIARTSPGTEMGHTRDSLLMGDYYDMGDYDIGDLIGDDDLGDLIGDDGTEIGRRKKRKLRRMNRIAKKQGLVVLPREAAMEAARDAQLANAESRRAAALEAAYSGNPQTARGGLAVSSARELMLPFGTLSLANTLAATGTITANVQRDIQIRRFLMTATDAVTFADLSSTVGVSLIKIGAEIVFNANGVVPLSSFQALAVGVNLMCQPATTGTLVEITLVRTVATTNASVIMAAGIGVSAGAR